jgi:hypothetical protein
MGITAATRQAYSEVDEFIELLDDYEKYQVPDKLREFFKKEKDPNYYKGINPNIPIKNQNLKEETLAIIALLNLQYWCDDEEEKERLKQVYAENEEKYFKYMKEKYNPENIFEKNNTEEFTESINEINENLPDVAEYKHSIFKKIWKKIKRIFTRKKDDANE